MADNSRKLTRSDWDSLAYMAGAAVLIPLIDTTIQWVQGLGVSWELIAVSILTGLAGAVRLYFRNSPR